VLETLRDRAMLMKLPRKVQKQIESEAAFSKARTEYYEKIGSAPTQKVRQKALQNLGDLARARAAMRLGSGDKDIGTGQGKAITRFDIEPSRNALDPARTAENADLKKKLAQIISNMPGNTGRVLQLRFLSDQAPMSMKEASAVMGLDESRASQLQTQAIELLLIRRPNMLQDLGFEATARKALPTKADVAEVSRRLNQIFIESRPTKNKKQHKTISGRA
jgi:DNA-directed RNA polymerase specialized sigma subunit